MTHAKIGAGCAALVAITLATRAHAAVEFYSLVDPGTPTLGGTLWSGSLDDGQATAIGQGSVRTTAALEFAPDGRLFGLGAVNFPGEIHTIDTSTGLSSLWLDSTTIGTDLPGSFVSYNLAFAGDGTLTLMTHRLSGPDLIARYDLATKAFLGSVTLGGAGENITPGGMAYRDDGMIIMIRDLGLGEMISVDPTTGDSQLIANLGAQVGGVRGLSVFNGVTYLSAGGEGQNIYTLDPYTGSVSFLTNLSGFSGVAFGFAVIPAPSGAAVFACLGLLAARRRR